MAQITSGYKGPNRLETNVSAAPSEGYELLRALAYDRKDDYQERRAKRAQERPRKSGGGGEYTGTARRAGPVQQERPREDPMARQLRSAQMRAEILRLQAEGGPMRMVHGAGIVPGYTMDVNAMNAYQRAAYLPTNSAAEQQDPRLQAIADRMKAEDARSSRQDWGQGY